MTYRRTYDRTQYSQKGAAVAKLQSKVAAAHGKMRTKIWESRGSALQAVNAAVLENKEQSNKSNRHMLCVRLQNDRRHDFDI